MLLQYYYPFVLHWKLLLLFIFFWSNVDHKMYVLLLLLSLLVFSLFFAKYVGRTKQFNSIPGLLLLYYFKHPRNVCMLRCLFVCFFFVFNVVVDIIVVVVVIYSQKIWYKKEPNPVLQKETKNIVTGLFTKNMCVCIQEKHFGKILMWQYELK